MSFRPSRLFVAIPVVSPDGKYWGRYPQGNKPAGMSGAAPITTTGAAQLSTAIRLGATANIGATGTGTLN